MILGAAGGLGKPRPLQCFSALQGRGGSPGPHSRDSCGRGTGHDPHCRHREVSLEGPRRPARLGPAPTAGGRSGQAPAWQALPWVRGGQGHSPHTDCALELTRDNLDCSVTRVLHLNTHGPLASSSPVRTGSLSAQSLGIEPHPYSDVFFPPQPSELLEGSAPPP